MHLVNPNFHLPIESRWPRACLPIEHALWRERERDHTTPDAAGGEQWIKSLVPAPPPLLGRWRHQQKEAETPKHARADREVTTCTLYAPDFFCVLVITASVRVFVQLVGGVRYSFKERAREKKRNVLFINNALSSNTRAIGEEPHHFEPLPIDEEEARAALLFKLLNPANVRTLSFDRFNEHQFLYTVEEGSQTNITGNNSFQWCFWTSPQVNWADIENCIEFLSKEMPDIEIDDNCLRMKNTFFPQTEWQQVESVDPRKLNQHLSLIESSESSATFSSEGSTRKEKKKSSYTYEGWKGEEGGRISFGVSEGERYLRFQVAMEWTSVRSVEWSDHRTLLSSPLSPRCSWTFSMESERLLASRGGILRSKQPPR
ncbi:hypothetical protein TNCV_4642841 [Trichonephila clavipes]|nr:hypothetical protein TNCV_4642841 [Trichonephila clavipes]